MTDLPTILGPAGLQPQSPVVLRAELVALVASTNPGYTADLPGSLIEDIASTDVGALIVIDQARVELVNSLTPFGCNAFTLNQLGQIYGVMQGVGFNTSVEVVFNGPPGFLIAQGFTVSDGTNQYIVQDGGILGSDGNSAPLFCLATSSAIFPVPANTVTQLSTSVPSSITLTVNNPTDGVPGTGAQSESDYRAQVLQAGLAASEGMPRYLRTLLENVDGVQARLISIRQKTARWEIIVGGGDQYDVANAIFMALFDISTLVGSTLGVTGITNANPGVVTTDLNHGFATGQVIELHDVVGMAVNDTPFTIIVLTEKTFSLGYDTTGSGTYVSGGTVTPNLRNETVTINDYPDQYAVPFVRPPLQTVTIALVWNTISPNFVSPVAVAQLGAPALVDYVNSVPVGAPMNLFELQAVFQQAVVNLVPTPLLTRMIFTVSINGIVTAPASGTGVIAGDPESYFFTAATSITISQG